MGDGFGIRFTCKFATGTEEEKEKGRLTMGMVHSLHQVAEHLVENLNIIRRNLAMQVPGEHVARFIPTSQEEKE